MHTGKRFEKALVRAGYRITRDAAQADILITHSGGCLLLPTRIRATLILQIGPYYWPGKSWLSSASHKTRKDLRAHHRAKDLGFWLRKSLWNLVYFGNLRANLRMYRGLRNGAQWRHGARTLVVRPRYDSFCTPDPAAMPFRQAPAFLSLGKHHDDCWRYPAPFIDLLQRKD